MEENKHNFGSTSTFLTSIPLWTRLCALYPSKQLSTSDLAELKICGEVWYILAAILENRLQFL